MQFHWHMKAECKEINAQDMPAHIQALLTRQSAFICQPDGAGDFANRCVSTP
jgi:hypothetical protein